MIFPKTGLKHHRQPGRRALVLESHLNLQQCAHMLCVEQKPDSGLRAAR
jgi:hypothetical protein